MAIYFARSSQSRRIKIGFTAGEPKGRLAELQTGCPGELHLLAVRPGTAADEKALHAMFSAARVQGEWFDPAPQLARYVAGLLTSGAYTFPWLASFEPKLWQLAEECGGHLLPGIDPLDVWYDEGGLKERLQSLVGWDRKPHPILGTEGAYDAAYRMLLVLLDGVEC